MSVLDNALGDLDVLLEGLGGSVDHDGGEAAVDAGLAGLEGVTVVQVQGDGDLGALDDSGLNQLHQVGVVGVGAGTLGNLQDNRSLLLLAGLGDGLDDLHVVDVESADGVAAVVSLLKHLSSINQRHRNLPFLYSGRCPLDFSMIIPYPPDFSISIFAFFRSCQNFYLPNLSLYQFSQKCGIFPLVHLAVFTMRCSQN